MFGKKLLTVSLGLLLTSATFADFGAIAYSDSTGYWGNSYGFGDLNTAMNVALDHCGVEDCEVKVWAENQCAALAVGPYGIFGWGLDTYLNAARDRAMDECLLRSSSCELIADICT